MAAVERMSWLLSQGVHRCHIGIVYPTAAVEGGIDGENSVNTAFTIGEKLYQMGIDFDFLDFESIIRAVIEDQKLCISGESYEWVILPDMKSVRTCMYKKLAFAAKKGVHVMTIASWPIYADAEIAEITEQLNRYGMIISSGDEAIERIRHGILKDVCPEATTSFYMNHRRIEKLDLYMTYGIPVNELCYFQGSGSAYYCDVWSGTFLTIDIEKKNDQGVWIKMPVASQEFQLILIGDLDMQDTWKAFPDHMRFRALDDTWNFKLLPTLDNTWGDFDLPASDGLMPVQLKQIHQKDYLWKMGYGPYFGSKEEFKNRDAFDQELKKAASGQWDNYQPYVFSMRYGVDGDPGHQGYHGLKGFVTDEFMRIGIPIQRNTEIELLPYETGIGKIFVTHVYSNDEVDALILKGSLSPEKLYVNEQDVTDQEIVHLHEGLNTVAAGYLICGRTYLIFAKANYILGHEQIAMSWYHANGVLPYVFKPTDGKVVTYWFEAPPALQDMRLSAHGKVKKIIAGETPMKLEFGENCELIATCDQPDQGCVRVEIEIEQEPGYQGGAVFDIPPVLTCGQGFMKEGDLSQQDTLKYYSGGFSYSCEFNWCVRSGKRVWLDLEEAAASAEVYVNGHLAGIRVTKPWRVEIDPYLKNGNNQIEIRIYNTLGNFYEFLPTRYKSGIRSGLIGKTVLIEED